MNMLLGLQYNEELKPEAITNGGFSYVEVPYEDIECKKFLINEECMNEKSTMKISGVTYPLRKLDSDKLFKIVEICKRYHGRYIVLETMNCEPGILEEIVKECADKLQHYKISIFIENGCDGDDIHGYVHNGYSNVAQLKKIVDFCKKICNYPLIGICIDIGCANLLAQNIRSQLNQCSGYLCLIHANDNGGQYNEMQMPYTFTKGRGDLTTDWYHIMGELIRMEFEGWCIFNTKGLFHRIPEPLQTQYIRMLHAIAEEWEKQFTFVDRILNQPDKKLILFGSGQMLWDYMETFGKKYPPCFAVDNERKRWGIKVHGVLVKSPDAILEVSEEERNVMICCMYYDAIGTQLRQMGVTYHEFQDRYFV